MKLTQVQAAVAARKQAGLPVSVRAIRRVLGFGSHRDLAAMLRQLRAGSDADETLDSLADADGLEQEPAPEPSPVPPSAPVMPQIARRTVAGEVHQAGSPLSIYPPSPAAPPSRPTPQETPATLSAALEVAQGARTVRRR